ncbi:hypothetical protein OROGR_005733 [Orobanche gracilis]
MSVRGVWQLQKLVVGFCNWGGSSRGISSYYCYRVLGDLESFMESHLPAFIEKNHQLEVVTELNRGYHPFLKGLYNSKQEREGRLCQEHELRRYTEMRDQVKEFSGKEGVETKDKACGEKS